MHDATRLREYLEQILPEGLSLLRKMVEINSFTRNPAGVDHLGQFTAEAFASLGFRAETVPSTNPDFGRHVILTREGSTPINVALLSHLDTVFPPEEEARNNFHWREAGDRIYGPGTNDIKGGTVMIWLILKALQAMQPEVFARTTWRILLNSSEEEISPDFGEVCARYFNSDTRAALVFECEGRLGDDHLSVVARKGRATWRIRVIGRSAHAGSQPDKGVNAIVQMGRVLDQVHALTDWKKGLTFNVATVFGVTPLNRVPHEAVAEGEMRAFTPDVYQAGKAALLALAGKGDLTSRTDGYPAEIQVEILGESRPWPRNPATDALAAIWSEAGSLVDYPMHWQERGGLSDGNLIWDIAPTLDGLGPWGDHAHCSESSDDGSKEPEYVDRTTFIPKAIVNITAILMLLERPAVPPPVAS